MAQPLSSDCAARQASSIMLIPGPSTTEVIGGWCVRVAAGQFGSRKGRTFQMDTDHGWSTLTIDCLVRLEIWG